MKYVTGGAIIAILVGMALMTSVSNVSHYEPILENVTEEKEVPEWMNDEDAVKAAEAVIQRKKLEAEREQLRHEAEKLEAEMQELKNKIKELDKQLGIYWQDEKNIIAYIREMFPEAPNTAVAIAYAESGMKMVQSNHKQTYGREESFCLFQVHDRAHRHTAEQYGLDDYKTNVESCVKMARIIYDQAGGFSPWSVYKDGSYKLAMR